MAVTDEYAGISCARVLAALGDYVDGELAADERARFEAHVRLCGNCARFGGTFGEVVKRLREAPADDEQAARFDRLRRRISTD